MEPASKDIVTMKPLPREGLAPVIDPSYYNFLSISSFHHNKYTIVIKNGREYTRKLPTSVLDAFNLWAGEMKHIGVALYR
jgi:hypothetical protein